MSNHCLRQDQGLMVSVEHPYPNHGFWGAKASLPKHVCFVLVVRILEKLVSHTVDQTLNGVLSSINLLVHFELKNLVSLKVHNYNKTLESDWLLRALLEHF